MDPFTLHQSGDWRAEVANFAAHAKPGHPGIADVNLAASGDWRAEFSRLTGVSPVVHASTVLVSPLPAVDVSCTSVVRGSC